MKKLLSRTLKTAVRLPFAIAWDVVTLGNLGGDTATGQIVEEHREAKEVDDFQDLLNEIREAKR